MTTMGSLSQDAWRVLRAIAELYRHRTRFAGDIHLARGYFDPSHILQEAKVLRTSQEFMSLEGKNRTRWYSAFEELCQASLITAHFATGLQVSQVRPTSSGMELTQQFDRKWWQRLGSTFVNELRHIVVSAFTSVMTTLITVVTMRFLGLLG